MSTFGKTTLGASPSSIVNRIAGSIFVCHEDGFAESIGVAVYNFTSLSRIKCAIYLAADLTLKGMTEELAGGSYPSPSWLTLNFPTPIPLIAGESYLLVAWSNSGTSIYRDAYVGQSRAFDLAYNGFPASIVAATVGTFEFSLYCTYNVNAPPPPPPDEESIVADSGLLSDIQAAVNAADTAGKKNVWIPQGRFPLPLDGSFVTVPEGINIYGDNTVLALEEEAPTRETSAFIQFVGSGRQDITTQISGVRFEGFREKDINSVTMYSGISLTNIFNFRVDHSDFQNIAGNGVRVLGLHSRGVIDHCNLVNTAGVPNPYDAPPRSVGYGVHITRGGTCSEWETDITKVLGQNTAYTVFIEDCHFEKWRHCVSSNNGAHYVLRHCTGDGCFGYGDVDSHGTSVLVGTRAIEVYNNEFINQVDPPGQADFIWVRGGAAAIFNNNLLTYRYFLVMINEGTVEKCWVHDVYVYDNIIDAAQLYSITGGVIVEGIDFHFSKPTWYEPYTYPHPLTLGETPPPPPQQPPQCTVDSDCPTGQVCQNGVCVTPQPPPTGGACLFYTATKGTVFAAYLPTLRRFRDSCLPRDLTWLYYWLSEKLSPTIKRIREWRKEHGIL